MPPRYHATVVVDNHPTAGHSWRMKTVKAMTIRLSADQAVDLETVALVDDQPVSDIIRVAISEHIASRRRDPQFREGLTGRIEQAKALLEDE